MITGQYHPTHVRVAPVPTLDRQRLQHDMATVTYGVLQLFGTYRKFSLEPALDAASFASGARRVEQIAVSQSAGLRAVHAWVGEWGGGVGVCDA